MSKLAAVTRYIVPYDKVLVPTLHVLKEIGRQSHEGIVAWGGTFIDETTFRFAVAYAPKQTAYATDDGLLVRVESEALHQLNVHFNEAGLILAGQAHSHPTDAYHSDTDDIRPIVTLLGGVSLVVPNFAERGFEDAAHFAWYRLYGLGDWREIDEELVTIEGAP
jgi:hypothetical protein